MITSASIKFTCRELANYKESQWMSFQDLEKQLDDLENSVKNQFQEAKVNNNGEDQNDNPDDSDDDINELYCVACNKSFKSDKA